MGKIRKKKKIWIKYFLFYFECLLSTYIGESYFSLFVKGTVGLTTVCLGFCLLCYFLIYFRKKNIDPNYSLYFLRIRDDNWRKVARKKNVIKVVIEDYLLLDQYNNQCLYPINVNRSSSDNFLPFFFFSIFLNTFTYLQ